MEEKFANLTQNRSKNGGNLRPCLKYFSVYIYIRERLDIIACDLREQAKLGYKIIESI